MVIEWWCMELKSDLRSIDEVKQIKMYLLLHVESISEPKVADTKTSRQDDITEIK